MATVWSFSIDNFNRDTSEVEALLELFEQKTRELIDHEDVHAKEVRVRYIGKLELLPESLQEAIRAAEAATAGYDKYFLNIAMAYGGRQEIAEALRRHLRKEVAAGRTLAAGCRADRRKGDRRQPLHPGVARTRSHSADQR